MLQIFYAPTLILALVMGGFISAVYDSREATLTTAQQQSLSAQKMAWAQEDASHAITLRQQAVEREKAHHKEFLQALGGAEAAAAKNPELNIQQMLKEVAVACTPAGTTVSVTVDRFTEFDVALVLPNVLPLDNLATISKSLLKDTSSYVHSLRIIQDNKMLANLNDMAIGSVTNWSVVSSEDIVALLLATETQKQSEVTAGSDRTNSNLQSEEDQIPDQVKIHESERRFSNRYKAHVAWLSEFVTDLNQIAKLENIQSKSQFDSQMALLDQMESQLAEERKYFTDPVSDFEHLLRDQGLDPLLIGIFKRGMADRERSKLLAYDRLFENLPGYLDQTKTFLRKMEDSRNQWSIDPQTHMIRFTNMYARDMYSVQFNLVLENANLVTDSLRALANSQPPK